MVSLLDINVLIALAWPNHVHHEIALRWFKKSQASGWATCPISQSGFTRVSSNSQLMPEARSPEEALHLLRRIVALPQHTFWNDDIAIATSEFIAPEKLFGYRQVTDAHLLALALRHRGRLVTLDQGVRTLVPDRFQASDVVCVLGEAERGPKPSNPRH